MKDSYDGDIEKARTSVKGAVARQNAAAATAAASQIKAEQIRQFVEDVGLMKDPRAAEIREVLERKVTAATKAKDAAQAAGDADEVKLQDEEIKEARSEALKDLRSHVVTSYMQMQLASKFPRSNVRKDVQIWQEQPGQYTSANDYKAKHADVFRKSQKGVKHDRTTNKILLEITDLDLLVTKLEPNGTETILHSEEIKTGTNDRPGVARKQLDDGLAAIRAAAEGGQRVELLADGKDIAGQLDLSSAASATSNARGPADKQFEASYEVTTKDLDTLIARLMAVPPPGASP